MKSLYPVSRLQGLLIVFLVGLQLLLGMSYVQPMSDRDLSRVGVMTIGAIELLVCFVLIAILKKNIR